MISLKTTTLSARRDVAGRASSRTKPLRGELRRNRTNQTAFQSWAPADDDVLRYRKLGRIEKKLLRPMRREFNRKWRRFESHEVGKSRRERICAPSPMQPNRPL